MKIGICFGGYCPMHRGHLDSIMEAKKTNDKVFVIVCGFDNEPRAEAVGMTLKERTCAVRKIFNDDEIINVVSINDTELGIDESMSLANWYIWQEKGMQIISYSNENEYTWYVAEPLYKESLLASSRFPFNVILIDKNVPVSGTLIRENPIKYWKYIMKPYRRTMCKNILITGTASEGKTTLTRDIARYFNLSHSEEYGRFDMLNKCKTDTDLTLNDFIDFMNGQSRDMESKIIENSEGVFISDTDNLVTLMYATAYADDINIPFTREELEERLIPLAKAMNGRVIWTKIFVLVPRNKFVDDGTRYMKQSSMEERRSNLEKLMSYIEMFGLKDKVTLLDGSFKENFEYVKQYINSFYGE